MPACIIPTVRPWTPRQSVHCRHCNNRIRKVATNGIITTVAGNGSTGLFRRRRRWPPMPPDIPAGVALDASGNLFIADWNNNRIRKVDTNGIITTVAGNGTSWLFRRRRPGHQCQPESSVRSVAVDASGNLFIADTDNNRIRKVDTNGIITTVAGNGSCSDYSGDGGPATNASLNAPYGVAVDASGNLFIADTDNNRIRKVDTNGIITTVAGNGSMAIPAMAARPPMPAWMSPMAWPWMPSAICLLRTIGTTASAKWTPTASLRRWRAMTAGVIPATAARPPMPAWTTPTVWALDAYGNLYIADTYNYRIRMIPFGGFPTLTLDNVTTNNEGNYRVIISSRYGSVTSSIVALTVVFTPSITAQPQSVTVTNGSNPASLTVTASGTGPLNYQWYLNTNTPVVGGTNATLTFVNAVTNETGSYCCVITNAYGSVTSSVVQLTVVPGGSLQVNIMPVGAVSAGRNGAWTAGHGRPAGQSFQILSRATTR